MYSPLVSCIMPTFNRPILLGESIKCYIDQDYPNKELIILNDQDITLRLKEEDNSIKIYNYPTRFSSLGEKRNYLKSLANGDYYCIWDDDDLYVPYRISESVSLMQKNPQYDIIKAKDAFISTDNKNYKIANNRFHAQAIVTKAYMNNNQYPNISSGEDVVFEKKADIGYIDIFPSFWSILRSGMDTYHISSVSPLLEKKSWEISGIIAKEYGNLKGEVLIEPKFQHDYWEDMRIVLNKIQNGLGEIWISKINR